ncbi:MAG: hypothetical protein A2Y33_08745 [Spirochaetes bacterium GWF1_51_8]|nr:MAG: hypothetical protein A2Y33_08745 [Spirochaetes bacterium GWF1_51_8]
MKRKKFRNTIVLASFQQGNNLNKASVIPTAKEKERHDRNYRKRQFRRMTELSRRDIFDGWNGGFFYYLSSSVKAESGIGVFLIHLNKNLSSYQAESILSAA